jgi:hypothetical protein
MQVYYFGRENHPGEKKFTDYYFVHKRTGNFLVEKKSDRRREISSLIRNGSTFVTKPADTEVEYTNLITATLKSPTRADVLKHIFNALVYNAPIITTPRPIVNPKLDFTEKTIVSYITKEGKNPGTKIEGTVEAIVEVCKLLGEKVDVSKLEGFDKTKWHYSERKNTWISIKEMNKIYIMNSTIKKIKKYFNNLKIEKTSTVDDFKKKVAGWSEDEEVKSLVNELNQRSKSNYPLSMLINI